MNVIYRVRHRILVLPKHHGYLHVSYIILPFGENPLLSATELSILSRGAKKQRLSGRDLRQGQISCDFMGFHGEITGEILISLVVIMGDIINDIIQNNRGLMISYKITGDMLLIVHVFFGGGLASGNGHDHNIKSHKLGYKPCNIVYITTI